MLSSSCPVDLNIYSSYSDSESDDGVTVNPKAIADAFRGNTGSDREGHSSSQEPGSKTKSKTRNKDKPSKWDSKKREERGKGDKEQLKVREGEHKPVRDREVRISSRREAIVTEIVKPMEKREERETVEAACKWKPVGTGVVFGINSPGGSTRAEVARKSTPPQPAAVVKDTAKDRGNSSSQPFLPHSITHPPPSQKSHSQKTPSQKGMHTQPAHPSREHTGQVALLSSPTHSKPSHQSRSRSPHQKSSHPRNAGGKSHSPARSSNRHAKRRHSSNRSRSRSRSPHASKSSKRSREHKHRYAYTGVSVHVGFINRMYCTCTLYTCT